MKHNYVLLVILLAWIPLYAEAQNIPKVEPYKVVSKLKPTASSALAKSAGNNALQQTLRKVATQSARQKFPGTAPDARTRSTVKNAVDISLIYELEYKPGQTFVQIKKHLLASGMVDYVEPLYHYEPLYVPNDPKADSSTGAQDHLKIIKAYQAWDISQGDSNVVIGTLDTGVRLMHEDLRDNLKYNYDDPIDGQDNDNDGYADNYHGWDMADHDNDPSANANAHGTLVTGVASATTNNLKGVAGVGFKCKFLPVKVFASSNQGSFRGYEGIVYAVQQGCKIINLSWGGVGFPSAFEQDIINYAAINRNVVIVAAAGNTNQDLDFYPSSYQNVSSVGSVTNQDIKSPSHTYSYAIKIAAQGSNVYTTGNSSNIHYTHGNGSSFASPMVAGAAALVRSHYPELTAPQVVERLRVTADDINALPGNAAYQEKLGRGRLNVYRALAEEAPKSVRLQSWHFEEGISTKPGEEIEMYGIFKNFLSPVSNVSITVTSVNEYLEVLQGQFTAGSMATLTEKDNQAMPFRFRVAANAPSNSQAILRFGFTDGAYTDYQYIKFNLNPDFVTTDVNRVVMSILSWGNMAYDGSNMQIGNGFRYRDSDPLLAEAGLLIGYSPELVSDNVRNNIGQTDHDFYSIQNIKRNLQTPYADFVANSIMEDSLTAVKNKSFRINQNVYAWADTPNQDFVVLEYILQNRTAQPIAEAFAGIYADWDILAAGRNVTEWNNDLKLGIIRHISDTSIWTGIQVLSDGPVGFYGLENTAALDGNINLADGFSDQDKFAALSGGVQRQKAGNPETGSDVSYIISTKVKPLAPNEQDTVAFAFVSGLTRAEIYQHAAAAAAKYKSLVGVLTGSPQEELEQATSLYPNPATGQVSILLPPSLQSPSINVQIIDSQGKLVQQSTHHRNSKIDLNILNLPNGLYLLRINSNGKSVVKKLLVSK